MTPASTTLTKLLGYVAGTADPATRREIAEQLCNPDSDVAIYLTMMSEASHQWMPWLLEAPGAESGGSLNAPEPSAAGVSDVDESAVRAVFATVFAKYKSDTQILLQLDY